MKSSSATFVFLAGIDNSGSGHWQRHFEARLSPSVWVDHADWTRPRAGDWLADFEEALSRVRGPVVVVAHSLGCLLLREWVKANPDRILSGAFCVAPPDPSAPAYPRERIQGFGPGDSMGWGFPAVVLASRDDPYGSFDYARRCASAWGAPLLDMGARGHLNAASGLGAWDQGWEALRAFLREHKLE